jgi:hypothetical protein
MALKLLIAGCSSDERDSVASIAKSILGGRPDPEIWNVSMVKVAQQWSVTIDGPDARFKGLSFVAPMEKLAGEMKNELTKASKNGAGGVAAAAKAPAAVAASNYSSPAKELKESHNCQECACPFDVIYEAHADEPRELAPVACPHCWHVNQVPIAEGASVTGEYKAQAPPD